MYAYDIINTINEGITSIKEQTITQKGNFLNCYWK